MAKQGSAVKTHRIHMQRAFSGAVIAEGLRSNGGPQAVAIIDTRTRRGKFIGGPDAEKGYSTKPIAAWKLGRMSPLGGGAYNLRSDTSNTSADVSPEQLKWYTRNGRRTALFMEGYRGWRELTGRAAGFVNLTFTGNMLRALDFSVRPKGASGAVMEIFVRGAEAAKAAYTHARRNWLGLTEQESRRVLDGTTAYLDKLGD